MPTGPLSIQPRSIKKLDDSVINREYEFHAYPDDIKKKTFGTATVEEKAQNYLRLKREESQVKWEWVDYVKANRL